MRFLLVACFLVGAYAAVLPPVPRLDGRIIGGEPADISEAPYQVALLLDWFGSGSFSQSCGGSIIREDVILTAAHCPEDTTARQWRIRAASTFSMSGGQLIDVARQIMHPGYDARLDFDVALMFLATPIVTSNQAALIALPAQNAPVQDGAPAFVTGWGSTSEGGSTVSQLQKVTIPVVNQQVCINAYAGVNPVTDRMICAGVPGQDACQGDSGGPLAIDGVVIGITSWGVGCARPGYPGVWSRVPAFRLWIDQEMQ